MGIVKRGKIWCAIIGIILCMATYVESEMIACAATDNEIAGDIEVLVNISKEEMKPYIIAFNRKYPQVNVKITTLADYENTIRKRIESGNYGDVFFIPGFITYDQYSQYLRALGSYTNMIQKYNYVDGGKRSGNFVYGLPSSAFGVGIIYNKDVFNQAGITEMATSMDDFIRDLGYVKEITGAIPMFANYKDEWMLAFWEYMPYIEMTGNADYMYNMFIYESNPFLEGSTHYEVYDMLYTIAGMGLCEGADSKITWDNACRMLNEGEIACMLVGSWAISHIQESGSNPESVAFMPFPNEINGKQYMTVVADYCYGVSRNSENPDAAKAFVEFMLDESGYALDHQTLSIVKTDPYPDTYGSMEDIILLCPEPAVDNHYDIWSNLFEDISLADGRGVARVLEAAYGVRNETFDDIAMDWNKKWEARRTPGMEVYERDVVAVSASILDTNYETDFSEIEKDYIREKQQLRVGYLKDMVPVQYENETGFTGVAWEMCNAISQSSGLVMDYVGYANVEQAVEALREGEIDMLAGVDKGVLNEEGLRYSKEYLSCMNVVVKKESAASSFEENGICAQVTGERNLMNGGEEGQITECATYAEALKLVEASKADYTVMNYYSADYYMEYLECEELTMLPLSDMGEMYFAFREDEDTRLVAICNKCIYGISDNSIQVMLRNYMEQPEKKITLRRFVEDNPLLCITGISSFFLVIVAAIILIMHEKDKHAKKQQMDIKRYETLSAIVNEYIFEYDYQKDTVHFDEKLHEKFGFEMEFCFKGYNPQETHSESIERVYQCYDKIVNEGKNMPEIQLVDKNGLKQWYRVVTHTIYDDSQKPQHIIGKIVNVQKEMDEKQKIADKAHKDPLTGVYNREGFDVYTQKLYEEIDKHLPMVLAVLDYDNFKRVNDTLGHAGGDEALKLLAQTLQEAFKEDGIVCRYGGDEFMFLVYDVDENTIEDRIASVVRQINRELFYQGMSVTLSISLGAVYTKTHQPFETLFKMADESLYMTKAKGKNNYIFRRDVF